MKRIALAAVLAASAVVASVSGQQPVGTIPLDPPPPPVVVDGVEVLKVQGQVYLVAGGGANVTAQVGDEGILLADSGGAGQTDKIMNALRRVTTKPVRYLVNLNGDNDHVSGNDAIVKAGSGFRGPRPQQVGGGNPVGQNVGVMTIAHENAYNRMTVPAPKGAGLSGDALPASTFFTPRKDIFANGEPIELRHQPEAHSDGDIFVYFRKSDVVSVGDVFTPHSYPVIDLARGGTVNGVIDALNTIIEITVPERNQMGGTRVIPGHGRIANEADVVDYRDMVTIVRDRVQEMIKKGMTLPQIRAANVTLEYDGYYGAANGPASPAGFLEAVYRSLGGK
jgi:glyoxylase-like metal-dependent hydrolase (beta-lactamase superfamily II)